ncbi:unnamed protein product [Ranitomeya imitator]|uniref:Uncharacterized protein n=1 Tax=Ranitomeya imitator TaxID=111125 RepID=A0ABN9MKM2_9NEOB|nr:unnamed protein product [Ranitomeya imitator]
MGNVEKRPGISVSNIILYPKCQCHYPVPRVSVSSSYTQSVIILYPECQCHYPVPRVSVSSSCTPRVSVIILYPKCQCHYFVPRVSLSCTLCQCHYPVPLVCSPSIQIWCSRPPGTSALSRFMRVCLFRLLSSLSPLSAFPRTLDSMRCDLSVI